MIHFNRRNFLKALGLGVVTSTLPGCISIGDKRKSKKPNIITILADDLGYGDLSCYGQRRFVTPNIDKLAEDGIRFTQHYAGSTVCAPSRSCLMTGTHTGHTRIRGNSSKSGERVPLQHEDMTIAEMLKAAGYTTGSAGKWGLGEEGTTGIPNEQGFDQWLGYLNQHNAHFYYPLFLWRNREKMILDNPDGERNVYSHDLFTHFALSFIAENKDRPFFLYLPYTIPHAELLVPEEDLAEFRGRYFEKPYNRRNDRDYNSQKFPLAAFAAMLTKMDRDVGKIVDLLRNLGIDDDTVIFFSSDNGPHGEGGADPDFFHSSGELRGMKRDLYEGGLRVPLVVKWPGKIEAGRISDHVSAFWDMMATCAELAGIDVPKDTDGISFVPELLGKGKQEQHRYLYWEFHERGGKQAVRKGKWKAVVLFGEKKFELYNLDNDPGETRNVALQFPEVTEEMKQILKEARSESPHWELPEVFY